MKSKGRSYSSSALAALCFLAAIVCGSTSQAQAVARNAYLTIQPNAAKTHFIHTLSWVAMDSQYSGSVYDDPLTPLVNEGLRDKTTRSTAFGNPSGSTFEVHTWDDPVGQTRYVYLPGPPEVEVRYQPPASGTNSHSSGYVYMGTDGSDGAVASAVGNSTPKWDDVGAYTTEPNGAYGHGWDGVTGFRTVSPDGTGTQINNGDGYYMDTDSIDGSAPLDDVGMIFVGFDALPTTQQGAPNTGYMQTIIPIATAASSTDDYFVNPNFFNPGATTWTSAYVEGVFTNNASIEVTVSSDPTIVPKLAVQGDFDGDFDVDNSDVINAVSGFTGSVDTGAGEVARGAYYRDGDLDDDYDVDNSDLGLVIGADTTATPGTGSGADLIYDPDTGNLQIDPADAAGGIVTSFQLENGGAGTFVPGNYLSLGAPFGGAFEDVTANVLGDTDAGLAGFSSIQNLGNVLPTGLDLAGLQAYLSTSVYTGQTGSGQQTFDLVVASGAVPEPSTFAAAILGLFSLGCVRRRRRRR